MSYFEKLEFTKDWTSADDFPTYEPDETQVRADMQLLHNEAKAALNALIEKLEAAEFAEYLAVSAEGMTATTLAAALAEVLSVAQEAQAGTIVDGTVAEVKLTEALRKKINDIDVTYSMNAPTTGENPGTGYALGKLWLKPECAVANLAGDYALSSGTDWMAENVTKEAADGKVVFSGTGDSQYGTATASLSATAGGTVRVYLTVEETAGQFASLKVYLNGTEYALTSGAQFIHDVTAGSDGTVTVAVKADWSNTTTAAGGKFAITAFAAVDKEATMLPGATALTDANLDSIVTEKQPFANARTRLELYGQQTAGVWRQLVPDEAFSSDELTVTAAVATKAGLERGATLSELLTAVQNSLDRIGQAINGETEGYVWNSYAYEQREVNVTLEVQETTATPTHGWFWFTVADSVAMNEKTGEITLVDPVVVSRNPVAGEYFTCRTWNYNGIYSAVAGVYLWKSGTEIEREQTGYAAGAGIYAYFLRGAVKVVGSLEYQGIVTSEDEDAYPADDWAGSVRYVAAPASQLSAVGKCATGHYTGTGMYGSGSPCTLEFTFRPKTVEIIGYSSGSGLTRAEGLMIPEMLGTSYAAGLGFGGHGKKSEDGKSVFWYGSSASAQFNSSGVTYYYRALG